MPIEKLRTAHHSIYNLADKQDLFVKDGQVLLMDRDKAYAALGLVGRVERVFGYGPMGFHTLHTTIEELAQESFVETRRYFQRMLSQDIERFSFKPEKVQQIQKDLKDIPDLKIAMYCRIREQARSLPPFYRYLLTLSGLIIIIREYISYRNMKSSPYTSLNLYHDALSLFYGKRIPLWQGRFNGVWLSLSLVLGQDGYKVEIYDHHRKTFNNLIFENREKQAKTNLHICEYNAPSPEAKLLLARFLNSLRDHINIFSEISADFSLKGTPVLNDKRYRRDSESDRIVDEGIQILLQLQQALDTIQPQPPSSPYVNLATITKVIREGL